MKIIKEINVLTNFKSVLILDSTIIELSDLLKIKHITEIEIYIKKAITVFKSKTDYRKSSSRS